MKRFAIKAAAVAILLITAIQILPYAAHGASLDGFVKKNDYTYGQFADVDEDTWYGVNGYGYVKDAYELGLLIGRNNGTFDPIGSLCLSEAVTIAARINSIYYGTDDPFSAEGCKSWYDPYVNYSLEHGIIYEGQFSDFTAKATRADMVKIFAYALPSEELAAINEIDSVPDVDPSDYAADEIYMLYRAGIVGGSDGYGNFLPNNTVTRAEAAAIITREAVRAKRLSLHLEEIKPRKAYVEGYGDKELVDLYLLTALSGEYEGNRGYTVKWTKKITYYIIGDCGETFEEHLDLISEKLNSIPGFPGIERTHEREEANLEIYFISCRDFRTVIDDVPENSWGYAQIWWNSDRSITSATILIDTAESDENARKSVISEELLQSLGLLYDNEDYPESIFYQWSNSVIWPEELDWAIVSLLYDPSVPAGIDYETAENAAYAYINR